MEKLRWFGEMLLQLPGTNHQGFLANSQVHMMLLIMDGLHVSVRGSQEGSNSIDEDMDDSLRNLEDRFRGLAD